jgi:hypothetical protein
LGRVSACRKRAKDTYFSHDIWRFNEQAQNLCQWQVSLFHVCAGLKTAFHE